MERQILNRDFYELFILDMHCLRNKGDVVLVPGIDQAASAGEIMDRGRILRIELNFEPEKTQSIADKFTTLAQSLAEIGQWYHRTGAKFGVMPEASSLHEPGAMEIWSKYISGYKDFDSSWEGIMEFCKLKGITGRACDLLAFMCYRYCKYESLNAPEPVLINAVRELSFAFIINGYSRKTERIDMLMEERDTRSYFPEREVLTLDDFRKMADYLEEIEHITGNKAKIFYNRTRSESSIEKLYRELIEMDLD